METLIKYVPRSGKFWSWSFVLWFLLLTYLSSGPVPEKTPGLEIPYIDKVAHFGYFFGGAGLLAAAIRYGKLWPWKKLLIIIPLILSVIGVYDEYHQSFSAGRTGNDLGDWIADTLGGLFGAFVFRWVDQGFLSKSASSPEHTKKPQE